MLDSHSVEAGCTSKKNESQADVVMNYVRELLGNNVKKSDIGIITPYVAQVQVIKNQLIAKGWAKRPKVKLM